MAGGFVPGAASSFLFFQGHFFQDSKLPLTLWFRAIWQICGQKNGISALGLQRVLGLGSYKTAWTMLRKVRRATVRPGRERLDGIVEVDEAYWGAHEEHVRGRQTHEKALVAVAVQVGRHRIGRIRLKRIADTSRKTLHGFINDCIEPGSTVRTGGLHAYGKLHGFIHDRQIQRDHPGGAAELLPHVHLVISLFKRWALGTHQGAISHDYLQDYLDEFTFCFNRRTSDSRGKLFYRLVEQAVQLPPSTFDTITT